MAVVAGQPANEPIPLPLELHLALVRHLLMRAPETHRARDWLEATIVWWEAFHEGASTQAK
jgi:hypothetical protein